MAKKKSARSNDRRITISISSRDLEAFQSYANLGSMADGDIMAMAFIVMMEAAKSAQEDLKSVMDGVKAINKQKAALREQLRRARQREAQEAVDALYDELDSLSEMGEMESLRLQMAMDRMTRMREMLSNILKKTSDTASSIIKNLK